VLMDKENITTNLSSVIQNLQFEKNEIEIAYHELHSAKNEVDRELLRRTAEIANLRSTIDMSTSRSEPLQLAIDSEKDVGSLLAEIRLLTEERTELRGDNGDLRRQNEDLRSKMSILQDQIDGLIIKEKLSHDRARESSRQLDQTKECYEQQVALLTLKLEEATHQAEMLIGEVVAQPDSKDDSGAVELEYVKELIHAKDEAIIAMQEDLRAAAVVSGRRARSREPSSSRSCRNRSDSGTHRSNCKR
jgi:hypothetical protein